MAWDDLSMAQRSEVIAMHLQAGIRDLGEIRASYNSFEEGGLLDKVKGWVNTNIRTSPHFVLRPSYNAKDYDSFDSAYGAARGMGHKTFVWQGKRYNTDYSGDHHKQYEADKASGAAAQWAKQNPGRANPSLVKAKQEELDTYGITNEFTRDRTVNENQILKNLGPMGYDSPLVRVQSALLGFKEDQRKTMDSAVSDIDDESFMASLRKDVSEKMDNANGRNRARVVQRLYEQGELPEWRKGQRDRLDMFGLILGRPQEHKSLYVSDYIPNGAESNHYFGLTGEANPSIAVSKEVASLKEALKNDYMSKDRKKKISEKINTLEAIVNKEKGNYLHNHRQFGNFTIGVADDYESYYDKWDINPFGKGKAKNMLGTPIQFYERFDREDQ